MRICISPFVEPRLIAALRMNDPDATNVAPQDFAGLHYGLQIHKQTKHHLKAGDVLKTRKSRVINIPKYSVHSEVDYPNIGMSDWKEVFQLFGLKEAQFPWLEKGPGPALPPKVLGAWDNILFQFIAVWTYIFFIKSANNGTLWPAN